jgi:predicted transcriptional regulator
MAIKPSSNIREKFGLDYLTSESPAVESPTRRSGPTDPAAEKTLAAFGNPILSKLDGAADKQARLFDLVDQTGLKIETLLNITDKLSELGLVHIVEMDKYGNHRVQLTPAGAEILRNG